MGKLECGMHMSASTTCTKRKDQTERQSQRTDFYHLGQPICRDLFKHIHCLSQDKLTGIIKHFKINGITERIHKNTKRLPSNTLPYESVKAIVAFITNYAEDHAESLPGRMPRHWSSNLRLLPSDTTKKKVWDLYMEAAEPGQVTAGISLFKQIWNRILPFITPRAPSSDLCWTCQSGVNLITRSCNLPEEEKSAALKSMEDHLVTVTTERSFLNEVIRLSKESIKTIETPILGTNAPCSKDIMMHYSFDFAQQVHFPTNPQQPGPVYFKTPRKCGLFGVCCEAVPQQINYLIDESVNVGKGANCVVSLLHHFLETYGLGEEHLHLHADNCSGQNKNSTMMWYLLWRVLTGLHKSITISFLITGHTKFSPDGNFGLVKRLFRRTKVDSLGCIEAVVNASSKVNFAHLIGRDPTDVSVTTYDWASYLAGFFVKVDKIKSYQHFFFEGNAGELVVKTASDDKTPRTQFLFKAAADIGSLTAEQLPEVVAPLGLDHKRKKYLFTDIREFVDVKFQDEVCPDPGAAPPTVEPPAPEPQPPPAKKARKTPTPAKKTPAKKTPAKRKHPTD